MPTKKTAQKTAEPEGPTLPDLGKLLREARPATETVTVPLRQDLAGQIRRAEDELSRLAADDAVQPNRRMVQGSPLADKAAEVESLREQMAGSELTFTFKALSGDERDEIEVAMDGRDDSEEINLRAVAIMCRKVEDANGNEVGTGLSFEQVKELRESLGLRTFELSLDEAAGRASGVRWSVPFSPTASHILATLKSRGK